MIAADMPAKKPLAVESGVAEPDPEVWFEEGNDVGGSAEFAAAAEADRLSLGCFQGSFATQVPGRAARRVCRPKAVISAGASEVPALDEHQLCRTGLL
jgi:hypothetical protein